MSLVNDMLKDLEARWPDAHSDSSPSAVMSRVTRDNDGPANNDLHRSPVDGEGREHSPLSASTRSPLGRGPWLLIGLGCAVFVVILVLDYRLSRVNERAPTTGAMSSLEKVLVASTPVASDPVAQSLESDSVATADSAAAATMTSRSLLPATLVREGDFSQNQVVAYRTPPTVDSLLDPEPEEALGTINERMAIWLREGDTAFSIDRLTTPKNDNAYDRYMAILALKPDHAGALQGLNNVRIRYLEIVEIAIIKKYYYKVPELIRKAREIGVSQRSIDELIAGLPEKDGKPTQAVLDRIAEYEASRGSQKTSAVTESSTDQSSVTASPKASSVTPSEVGRSNIVTMSFSQKDRKLAGQANHLIDQRQLSAAKMLLESFVQAYPKSVIAYQSLFNLYLEQEDLNAAETLIGNGDHINDKTFSYMVAQLLVSREDFDGALRALSSQTPRIDQDPDYHALKAGVFHKLGQHDYAARTYRELISIDGANATYWLGLAVVLDASDQAGALSAFQKVQQLAGESEPFLPYVRTRIGALATNR